MMAVTVLRTHSSLVVPLLLALHSTTRAMTPAMAAVSNTPPMKPPVAAPEASTAQSSAGNRCLVEHNGIHTVCFGNKIYQSLIKIN